MRRLFLSATVAAVLALVLALPAFGRMDGGCPDGGFDRVYVGDAEDAASVLGARYPSVRRGLDENIYTAADMEAQFPSLDRNGNGWLCIKDVWARSGERSTGFYYFVSAIDDNAAP